MTGDIQQNSLLFNRPMSSNGLPTGDTNIKGVASLGAPLDYYIEALEGERLLVSRFMIHIVDGGVIDSGTYGNGIILTNGIQLFHRRSGIDFDITGGMPIKINPDWARLCYDTRRSSYGSGNETLNARWTLTKYGTKYGIILEEGDRLGIRLRDNLSGLVEQTIIANGIHLGTPNPEWNLLL